MGLNFKTVGWLRPTSEGAAPIPWYEAAGVTAWAAYQPKGAASLAASLTDLSGNGRNAGNPGGAASPTWNATNGWVFDGIAQYLTTTFVPSNDQTQSVIVQFTNAVSATRFICGCQQAAGRIFGLGPLQAGNSVRYQNGSNVTIAPQLAAGNLAVAGAQGYRNGVADGGAIGAWVGPTLQAFYIGCNNNTGTAELFQDAYIQALAIYDVTLTAPQVAAVAAAMASL